MNVSNLPVAVLVLDADRTVLDVNEATLSMLGYSRDEMLGKPCGSLLRPRTSTGEDLLVDWHRSARLRSTRRINEQDVLVRRGDGSEIELLVDGGYERDESGALVGATLLLRRRHRGQRPPRSGIRIVSAISHELRSPLTSVRGYTAMLLKRWDIVSDEERKQMLQQVDRDARRISRVIGELLDITRLEMGRMALNRVDMEVASVVRDVVETVRMTYPDADVTIDVAAGAPRVWADADKVGQVLTNLIENACKYASPKGIVVSVFSDANSLITEVSDQGPGIPAADMPRLFQQFFRSSQGRPTGTGLGLWISRGLIESHGGELTARSDGVSGTTFRFTLPLHAFEDLHGRARRAPAPSNDAF